jgi:hypothetical protein
MSDGVPGVVTATNDTELVIARTPNGWATSQLVIGHEDGSGGRAELVNKFETRILEI